MIHYPFRYLHSSIKTSLYKEAVWFCVKNKCCLDRNYDVGVTLRQVFDPILSGHDTYSETDSVYNSFRRPSDFDISGCSVGEIIENIKLNSDIVIVKFEFVYNPLCINRLLDFVHDTTNEYPKCVQTLLMVTNSLHDVEGIKTAASNVVGKIAIGTNCMDMLQMVEYNALGQKYVVVCDAAHKNSDQHEQMRCICPYYIIKIESKSKMVPQLQMSIVEGLLYRELALVLPIAKKYEAPAVRNVYKIETKKTTQKILYVKNRPILLNACATKVLLNKDSNIEYQIEEFLRVKKGDRDFYIVGLSTNDQKQQERITAHNKTTTILSIDDVNPHLLYISIQNQLTIKISPNDRVFVTPSGAPPTRGPLVGEGVSTLGATGFGTVRCILHPHTNASYNLHEHFTDLVYMVEFDNAEISRRVVQRNIAKINDHTLQFAQEPVHYLRCEIFDIYQCCE